MKIKLTVVDTDTGMVLEHIGTCLADSVSRALQMYDNDEAWQDLGYSADIHWVIVE